MFRTPSASSHFSSASAPLRTKTPTPSFQVARPQSTPQKCTPASDASSRASLNARLLTPAERNKKGFVRGRGALDVSHGYRDSHFQNIDAVLRLREFLHGAR